MQVFRCLAGCEMVAVDRQEHAGAQAGRAAEGIALQHHGLEQAVELCYQLPGISSPRFRRRNRLCPSTSWPRPAGT